MSLALLIICHPIFADKTLEEIDRVSDAIVSLMERNLKPDIKPTVNLLPFLTDDGKESTLGNRIHSNAKLHLLKNASISSSSSIELLDTQTPYTLSAELQPFQNTVRILIELHLFDKMIDGESVDLPLTNEIIYLLEVSNNDESLTQITDPLNITSFDRYEPDDIPGFEVAVNLEENIIFERLLSPGDRDRFLFYVEDSQQLTIETHSEIDTQLLLYLEGDRIPFTVNDDREDGKGSRLMEDLDTGWYIAEVVGYNEQVVGAYNFTIIKNQKDSIDLPELELTKPDSPDAIPEKITSGIKHVRTSTVNSNWIELNISQLGFYNITGISKNNSIGLSLHNATNQPAIMKSLKNHQENSATLTFFYSGKPLFANIYFESNQEINYSIETSQVKLVRKFADGNPFIFNMKNSNYHTLRIFTNDSYVAIINGDYDQLELKLFSLPNMAPIEANTEKSNQYEYTLEAGDYLTNIELSGNDSPIQLCWISSGHQTGVCSE